MMCLRWDFPNVSGVLTNGITNCKYRIVLMISFSLPRKSLLYWALHSYIESYLQEVFCSLPHELHFLRSLCYLYSCNNARPSKKITQIHMLEINFLTLP